MRQLTTPTSCFHVTEQFDYSLCLTRNRSADQIEPMGLYCVLINAPFVHEQVYVLAESKKGAIEQARGVHGLSSYQEGCPSEESIHCTAVRLPLIIRGWSKTEF